MTKPTDFDLLDAYARQHSEEAFRELVGRHVDFIYSAALRQLQNPHLAQEATQAAFIALAGKAGQLRRQTIIAGWLHHAARFAAMKLQRTETRLKHWEQKAAAVNVPPEAESAFPEEALSQVDAALDDLGESDRNAVILRFFRQMSLRDVADAIGISEDAAKKRVSRALDKLRDVLIRRGITVSVTALAAGLSQLPLTAAPVALPSAVAALAPQTPAVPAGAAIAGFLASVKLKLAIAAFVAVVGGLAILLWPHGETNVVTAPPKTNNVPAAMRIKFTSVMVDNQDKALRFYTDVPVRAGGDGTVAGTDKLRSGAYLSGSGVSRRDTSDGIPDGRRAARIRAIVEFGSEVQEASKKIRADRCHAVRGYVRQLHPA